MKKTLLGFAIVIAFSFQANGQEIKSSQSKFSVFLGSTFCGNGTDYGTETSYNNLFQLMSTKQLRGSAGNGIVFGADYSYFPVENFGLSAGVSFLNGRWQQYDKESYANGSIVEEEYRGNYASLTLDVVLRTSCEGPWHGQATFGPSLFPSSNTQLNYTESQNGVTNYDIRSTLRNKFGIGLNAGFGGDYQVNERIAIGFDFRSTIFSGTGKTEEYTKYWDKGEDKLAKMDRFEIETNFVKELTRDSNYKTGPNYDKNRPEDKLAPKTNYNNYIGTLRTTFTF